MLKVVAVALYTIGGLAAGLYLTVVAGPLGEKDHPSPWLPTPWLLIPIAIAGLAGLAGFICMLVAQRAQQEKPALPSSPVSASRPSTASTDSRPTQAPTVITRRRASFGPIEYYGDLMLMRKISGPWSHEVSWRNGKTIGYLAAGRKNGYDAYNVNEELLDWAADRWLAAELVERSADE
jgi:hypothetical protein